MTQAVVVLTPEQVEELVQRTLDRAASMKEQREVLDSDGVAEMLGMNKRTVLAYVESEGLPGHHLGGTIYRFRRSEVLAWLTARKAKQGK